MLSVYIALLAVSCDAGNDKVIVLPHQQPMQSCCKLQRVMRNLVFAQGARGGHLLPAGLIYLVFQQDKNAPRGIMRRPPPLCRLITTAAQPSTLSPRVSICPQPQMVSFMNLAMGGESAADSLRRGFTVAGNVTVPPFPTRTRINNMHVGINGLSVLWSY